VYRFQQRPCGIFGRTVEVEEVATVKAALFDCGVNTCDSVTFL
jgi:hypothetical protein